MIQRAEEPTLLITMAKALGKTAGKIAGITGATGEAQVPKPSGRSATGKFPEKDKSRLPRRQKKAQKKTHRPGSITTVL